jgi:hypothetical protein
MSGFRNGTLFTAGELRGKRFGSPGSGVQPDHKPRAAPKLNVRPIKKARCFLDGLDVVSTNERFESDEMPVAADGIRPILCHPESPLTDIGR